MFGTTVLNTQLSDADFHMPPFSIDIDDHPTEDFTTSLVLPDFGAGIWYTDLERFLGAWFQLPGDRYGSHDFYPDYLSSTDLAELRKEHRASPEEIYTATQLPVVTS